MTTGFFAPIYGKIDPMMPQRKKTTVRQTEEAMPQQPMTRDERLKQLAQMRIDALKKMRAGQHGRVPHPVAPSQPPPAWTGCTTR